MSALIAFLVYLLLLAFIVRLPRKPKPPVVKRLAVTRFMPGDIVVFQTDRRVPRDQFEKIKAQVRSQFPPGTKILFLESGIKVGVLSSRGWL